MSEQRCKWIPDDPDIGAWGTSCGRVFEFTNDGPEENGYKFCPGCGGRLHLERTDEEQRLRQ